MAITAQELNVILSARDKQFTKAMDRAQKRVERFSKKSQKDLSRTTKSFSNLSDMVGKLGIAFSTGALATGLARSIDQSTKFAKELTNLSTLAGVGVEDFQRLSFAAKTVGVEQDKLADILKDVNDKFGDFAVTGAGPLVDFFEQIAPKVGITADAFKGLSSADALGLYVQKLEEAGVNQQQLTFFMEALASDATLLTPLLLNNGEAMDMLGEKAQKLGVILSSDLVSDASELRKEFEEIMSKMTSSAQKFFMTTALGFAEIFNVQTDRSKLKDLQKELDQSMTKLSDMNVKLVKIQESLSAAENRPGIVGTESRIVKTRKQQIKITEIAIKKELERFTALRDQINALKDLLNPQKDPLKAEATNPNLVADDVVLLRGAVVGLSGDMKDLHRVSDTLEGAFEDVFMAAIEGSKSFKDTLRSTASAVIRELYRILVVQRLVNSAMGFLGVTSGGANVPVGNLAAGGYMQAGQAAVVGEHGRELFVPSTAGRVLSVPQAKAAISGGDGVVVQQTINITTGVQQTVRNEIRTLMPQIAESTKNAVADAKRRGGSYGRAFS